MGVAIAAAAVAAGGAAGSAYLKGKAQKSALAAMRRAWQKLQLIDIPAYEKTAYDTARKNYLDRFRLFREGDPELAQVRDVAVQNALDVLSDKSGHQAQASEVAKRLSEGALDMESDSRAKVLEQSLMDRAQKNLDLGAQLPPEFQAELVRSGLETGGRVGTGTNRQGPLSQVLGKKIGSEQIALERQRAADALSLAQGSQALRTNRLNILAGIAPALQNLDIGRFNLASQGIGVAEGAMPDDVGLTGRELLNLKESNRALENQRTMALGGIKAQKHIVSGDTAAAYLNAGTSFLTGLLGGMGGGAGGAGGGAAGGGGGGFNLGSIMSMFGGSSGGQAAAPQQVNYTPQSYIPQNYGPTNYLAGLSYGR